MSSGLPSVDRNTIARVMRTGKTFSGSLVTLKRVPNSKRCHSFVVSKKVSSSAVVRNRVRRRMKAVVQKSKAHHKGLFVWIAKPLMKTAASSTIKEDIESILDKVYEND